MTDSEGLTADSQRSPRQSETMKTITHNHDDLLSSLQGTVRIEKHCITCPTKSLHYTHNINKEVKKKTCSISYCLL